MSLEARVKELEMQVAGLLVAVDLVTKKLAQTPSKTTINRALAMKEIDINSMLDRLDKIETALKLHFQIQRNS